MAKFFILLIFFTIMMEAIFINRILSAQQRKHSPTRQRFQLRKFGLSNNREVDKLTKAYEIQLKLEEKMEKQILAIEMKKKLKAEEKRRKIYEKHLLTYQGGSNFLKDFHTNRF